MKRAAINKLTKGLENAWAIYARVSKPVQAEEDKESLPRQLNDCHKWLHERGFHCYDEYIDPGEEGDELHRPGLDRLRMDMRRGRFGGIICQKYDRFSRDTSITDIMLYEADEYDVDVQFVMEERNRGPLGKLELAALGISAELEHENIRFRALMGMEGRAKRGNPLAGKKPLYGYRWDNPGRREKHCYVIYEPEAAVVRRIFSDYRIGLSCRKIAAALERESIKGPYGGERFLPSAVYYILRQPAYTGHLFAFRHLHTFRKEVNKLTYDVEKREGRAFRDVTDDKAIPLPETVCPAIISEEEWQQVQDRRALAQRFNPRSQKESTATLLRGGFALCGHCGRVMTAGINNGAYRYLCHAFVNNNPCSGGNFLITAAHLDKLVWEVITHTVLDAKRVRQLLTQIHHNHELHASAAIANTHAIDGQIQDIQQAVETLIQRLERPELDEETVAMYEARLAHHRKTLKKLEAHRIDAAAATVEARAHDEALEAFESWATDVTPHLNALTYSEKRTILIGLDVRAVVWRSGSKPRALVLLRFGDLVQAYATGIQELPLLLEQQAEQLLGLWDSWDTVRAALQERLTPVLEHWKGRINKPFSGRSAFSPRLSAGYRNL